MQSSAEAERARLAAVLRFARCLLSASACLSLSEEEESAGGEGDEGVGDFESASLRLQLQHRKEQLSKALGTFCDVISSWFVGSVRVLVEEEAGEGEDEKDQDRKQDGPSLLAAILVPAAAKVDSDSDQLGAVPPMVPLR